MNHKRIPSKLFLISLFIPILVLLSMLIKPVITMLYGDPIRLATAPVDPTDLFYGNYLSLNLEITQVNASLLDKDVKEKAKNSNQTQDLPVFVSLVKGENGVYQVKNVSEKKPDGLFIKGKMKPFMDSEDNNNKEPVQIDYGIDRYYVGEGTGSKFEKLTRNGKLQVDMKIFNGYAVLTGIQRVQ